MSAELKLRQDNLEWREVEGEVIVLDLQGSLYMSVNGSGTVCWHALVEGTDRDALVSRIAEQFNIPPERAEQDVDAFLEQLRSHGLLETAPESGG